MKHLESIASGRVCNRTAERLLDRVLAEAPAGQLGRGPEPRPARGHDEASPLPLGRERGDGSRPSGAPESAEAGAHRLALGALRAPPSTGGQLVRSVGWFNCLESVRTSEKLLGFG